MIMSQATLGKVRVFPVSISIMGGRGQGVVSVTRLGDQLRQERIDYTVPELFSSLAEYASSARREEARHDNTE